MENKKIGQFAILKEIGRGGFGTVYLAYDEETNEHVALKKVENFSERKHERRGLYYYKKNREHFRYENIISIHETIKNGDDMYYSMPIADGMGGAACTDTAYAPKTLELVIKERLNKGEGWFGEDEILDIIIPIARALAAIDKRGLKHRDVKPANIIFINGRPMLSDFGLAAQDTSSLSRAGTADYTPPAWFSDSGGDPDMWGFAMTFFALFSGRPPSESKNNRKYPKNWSEKDNLKNCKAWDKFAQIVFRVKNENESERFPNWNALLDAIYSLRGYADKTQARKPNPAKKKRILNCCLASFLAVLILLVGFIAYALSGESEEEPQTPAQTQNGGQQKNPGAEELQKLLQNFVKKPEAAEYPPIDINPQALGITPENVELLRDKINGEVAKRTSELRYYNARYRRLLGEKLAEIEMLKAQIEELKNKEAMQDK